MDQDRLRYMQPGHGPYMTWGALLEAVHGLHRAGMSIPIALEQHAYSGDGASQALANRWLERRCRSGDPVHAMRGLAHQTRGHDDRIVAETLVICLERPGADHHQTLGVALDQLRLDRVSARGAFWTHRRASRTLTFALVLTALSGGDNVASATQRVATAFGERHVRELRLILARAERGAITAVQVLQNALAEERSQQRRLRGRLSWTALPRAAGVALALTLAALGVIVPGSAELTIVGW